ncbi:MAG: TnpV protein [Erysipelotrichaceae bacterium]|nr:TnpV protein [Erysipelotrichaceae bacterium]
MIKYTQVGDYLIPNLKMNEESFQGKYSMMRMNYLRNNNPALLLTLRMKNQLNTHLREIQLQSTLMKKQLMNQLIQNTQLPNKETHQMEWVKYMNNIENQAEEIIIKEIIYS